MERTETKTRNEEIRNLYHTTDALQAELGKHFNLSNQYIYFICKGTKKAARLIRFPHRETKPPVKKNTGVVGNYSNRLPHPRTGYDYGLVPLNPAFRTRYIQINKEYLEGGAL